MAFSEVLKEGLSPEQGLVRKLRSAQDPCQAVRSVTGSPSRHQQKWFLVCERGSKHFINNIQQ